MSHRTHWRRARIVAGLVALLLVAASCGWGMVLADRAAGQAFVLPGATDVRHERLGIGLQRVTFRYVGADHAEREWLRHSVLRGGFKRLRLLGECAGLCRAAPQSLGFTRRSLGGLLREVALVSQSGRGTYAVRVDLRRCIKLPGVSCWPR